MLTAIIWWRHVVIEAWKIFDSFTLIVWWWGWWVVVSRVLVVSWIGVVSWVWIVSRVVVDWRIGVVALVVGREV